jgi:hypothetical protein
VYGHKLDTLDTEAARVRLNGNTLRQAWRAAREYTAEQIAELCALVTEHRARFGPTHLARLLAVEDRELRDAMTREAIRGGGVARLGRAIQAARGERRPGVGKKPSVPAAEPELLPPWAHSATGGRGGATRPGRPSPGCGGRGPRGVRGARQGEGEGRPDARLTGRWFRGGVEQGQFPPRADALGLLLGDQHPPLDGVHESFVGDPEQPLAGHLHDRRIGLPGGRE